MPIQIKLQIEIDDVEDVQLLEALESLLKTVKRTDNAPTSLDPPKLEKTRRRRPPKPRFADGPPEERWQRFLEALPIRAQDFVSMIENAHPDVLSQSEAMAALDIQSAKAMGGLTGSITRWASVDNIRLPWVREERDGERTWRWIGIEAALHGLDRSLPKLSELVLEDYQQLSPRLFRLLSLVHEAGEVNAAHIADAMQLSSKAALTGLESALKRWIPSRGLPLPISMEGQGDERTYRWLAGDEQ